MRQTFEVIEQRIKKCDTMLIAPCIGFGSRIAAEKFNVPLATVVLSPFVMRSEFQSPVIKPMLLADWVPRVSKRLQFWLADRFVIDPLMKSEVNALCAEAGLLPQSRFLHRWCFSKDLTVALFPDFFAPTQPDWPPHVHHTGLISWDPPIENQVSHSLESFLDQKRKPIVVLAGSAGPESTEFYQNWIAAAQRLDRQLILLERNQNLVPQPLPDHVFHARFFPIDQVVVRAALIAHCGGVGTTLRSLAAGVPQIVCPKVNDQPDNADRVARMGVGSILHQADPSVERIVDLLDCTIDNQEVLSNCRNIQAQFADVDPTQKCCDLIEATFRRYRT